jgi:hypothetical protein
MMERMLTKVDSFQAKMDTNLQKMEAELRVNNEKFKFLPDALVSRMRASVNAWREEMKANQKAKEACLEPTSLEVESEVEHEEVFKEDAAVETSRAPNKRHGDRNLTEGQSGKPKERTQGKSGCRKKLATARRRMTRRAGVARCKGHCRQGQGKDSVVRGVPKGRTLGRRHQPKPECKNGIGNRGLRQQLHLGSKRAFNKIVRKSFGLEFVKRIVGSSVRMREVGDWTL